MLAAHDAPMQLRKPDEESSTVTLGDVVAVGLTEVLGQLSRAIDNHLGDVHLSHDVRPALAANMKVAAPRCGIVTAEYGRPEEY